MADEKKTPKSGSSSKEKSKSKSESKSKRAKASDPKVRAKAKTKAKGKSSESSSSKSSQKASGNNQDAFVLSGLSSITSFTPLHVLIILFTVFILLHLYLPLFLIPHLSAAVTLVIPIQNTIKSITAQKGSGSKDNGDAPQWLLYWIVYTIIGWMRGTMSLWRPHWRGVFEVGRSASLIVVGGAWFGRKGLKGASKQAERK